MGGSFHDRDLYIAVIDLDAKILAHGQRQDLIGKDLIDIKDPDGKLFMKERVELARNNSSFWQNYKFMNPTTKQVDPSRCIANGSTKPRSAAVFTPLIGEPLLTNSNRTTHPGKPKMPPSQ
jgi:Single Cache domain 2